MVSFTAGTVPGTDWVSSKCLWNEGKELLCTGPKGPRGGWSFPLKDWSFSVSFSQRTAEAWDLECWGHSCPSHSGLDVIQGNKWRETILGEGALIWYSPSGEGRTKAVSSREQTLASKLDCLIPGYFGYLVFVFCKSLITMITDG